MKNGTVYYISDKEPTLEQLKALVGGRIEVIHLADGRQMVLNEEGKIDGLPANPEATALARPVLWDHDTGIVGDVVVLRDDALLT